VLNRDDTTSGEAATVADAIDLVQDRHGRIAGPEEVGMQRMDVPTGLVHSATGGDKRLAGNLAAEDALPVLVGGAPPEDVDLQGLQVEQGDEIVERSHCGAF
jgi:hypothetical protein